MKSAITGESRPGDPRMRRRPQSAVTGGNARAVRLKIKVQASPSNHRASTFLDRMIALVEGAERQKKTPNEIALNILLAGLTLIFLLAAVATAPARQPTVVAAMQVGKAPYRRCAGRIAGLR